MRTFLLTLHILTCVSLIIVVLIQRGKGADMGAMLGGGGSQTVFGARGAGNFLTKLTTGAAIIFMVTSLTLSYFATQDSRDTIFDGAPLEDGSSLSAVEEATPEADPSLLEEIEDTGAGALEEIEDAAAGGLEEVGNAAESAMDSVEDAGSEIVDDLQPTPATP